MTKCPYTVPEVRNQIWSKWQIIERSLSDLNAQLKLDPNKVGNIFKYELDKNTGSVQVNVNRFYIAVPNRTTDSPNQIGVEFFTFFSGWLRFSHERNDNTKMCLEDYRTRVEYYRKRGNKVRSLCSLHYDFEKKLDSDGNQIQDKFNHPYFHAQLTNS